MKIYQITSTLTYTAKKKHYKTENLLNIQNKIKNHEKYKKNVLNNKID